MSPRFCLFSAAVLGMTSVILGAFAAHGLTNNSNTGYLDIKYSGMDSWHIGGLPVPASFKYLRDFQTAATYQMTHALALAITGVLMLRQKSKWLTMAAIFFLGGVLMFCGALYLLVVAGPHWLGVPWGAIVPVGGMLLILGWSGLAGATLTMLINPDKTAANGRS